MITSTTFWRRTIKVFRFFFLLVYGEVCSHFKALEFYALSIREKEKFKSIKCDSWDDYTRSSCNDGDEYTYLGEYADSG